MSTLILVVVQCFLVFSRVFEGLGTLLGMARPSYCSLLNGFLSLLSFGKAYAGSSLGLPPLGPSALPQKIRRNIHQTSRQSRLVFAGKEKGL